MCSEEEDINLTPPRLPVKKTIKHRAQKFRSEWLLVDELKKWLCPVNDDPFKAKCKICNCTMVAELTNIKSHGKGSSHRKILACKEFKKKPCKTIESFITTKTDSKFDVQVKSAEIKLTAFINEHNIAFLAADHLVDVLKSCFPDSNIAKNLKMKRTKVTAITTNVIGAAQKYSLTEYLKTVKFSILTDESTDIGTIKTSCVVLRFFDKNTGKIESKFWDLYEVYNSKNPGKATAEKLFN
ncbi:Uncharacterized protein FWK35_00037515, partial [Aphis craccivora]